jgi:hypothetical protein
VEEGPEAMKSCAPTLGAKNQGTTWRVLIDILKSIAEEGLGGRGHSSAVNLLELGEEPAWNYKIEIRCNLIERAEAMKLGIAHFPQDSNTQHLGGYCRFSKRRPGRREENIHSATP